MNEATAEHPLKALLMAVQVPPRTAEETLQSLSELAALATTLGAEVLGQVIQSRLQIHPASFFGSGKLSEVKSQLHELGANLVLIDGNLSPKQAEKLERVLDRSVLDRTQLILMIFARNARTREAKLQIELAQAEYLLPRLVGMWQHLDRERGGIGVSRGAGEKQIDNDRQFLRNRIAHLKEELRQIEDERRTQKKRRTDCFQVSLIGYTNAGKSTIMNALTHAQVLVEDKLFATLDSTTRLLPEDSRPRILLSDTVGFIRNLPHQVVASFRSTLGIVADADLLLHVVDLNADYEEHIETTLQVLDQIGANCVARLLVFNKTDEAPSTRLFLAQKRYPEAVFVSALQGEIASLQQRIMRFFEQKMETMTFCLEYKHSHSLAQVYEWSRVDKIAYEEDGIHLTLTSLPENLNRLKHHLQQHA